MPGWFPRSRLRALLPLLLLVCGPAALRAQEVILLDQGGDRQYQVSSEMANLSYAQRTVHELRSTLQNLWRLRRTALEAEEWADAKHYGESLIEAHAFRRFFTRTLVEGFVTQGNTLLRQGHPEPAQDSFLLARGLDPDHPGASLGLARAAFARQQWGSGIAEAGRALMQVPRVDGNRRALTINGYLLGSFVLAGWTVFLALVLLIKSGVLLRHRVREALGEDAPRWAAGLLAWVACLLPCFLTLDPTWLVPYWLVVFGSFQSWGLRATAAALFLALAAFPLGLRVLAQDALPTTTPLAQVADAYHRRSMTEADLALLEVEGTPSPDNVGPAFFLSNIYLDLDRPEDALQLLRKVLQADPEHAKAYNNIGNIYFMLENYAQASTTYQRAMALDPLLVEPYYNLALTHYQEFEQEKADELLNYAQTQLDADELRRIQAEGAGGTVVHATIDPKTLTAPEARARSGLDVNGLITAALTPVSAVALLGLILIGLGGTKGQLPFLRARACAKCGRPFCPRCIPRFHEARFCSQCQHIYIKKDGVSPEARMRKQYEVEEFTTRMTGQRKLANLLLPGAAHLFVDQTAWGCLLLLIWAVMLAPFAFPGTYLPLEAWPWVAGGTGGRIVALLPAGGFWLLFGLVPLFKRERWM